MVVRCAVAQHDKCSVADGTMSTTCMTSSSPNEETYDNTSLVFNDFEAPWKNTSDVFLSSPATTRQNTSIETHKHELETEPDAASDPES